MDVVSLKPEALKYGTEKVPPPIPSIEERNPIIDPAKIDSDYLGYIFLEEILISNRICIPTSKTNISIDNFKNDPSI